MLGEYRYSLYSCTSLSSSLTALFRIDEGARLALNEGQQLFFVDTVNTDIFCVLCVGSHSRGNSPKVASCVT